MQQVRKIRFYILALVHSTTACSCVKFDFAHCANRIRKIINFTNMPKPTDILMEYLK